jgi:hypothetical protein
MFLLVLSITSSVFAVEVPKDMDIDFYIWRFIFFITLSAVLMFVVIIFGNLFVVRSFQKNRKIGQSSKATIFFVQICLSQKLFISQKIGDTEQVIQLAYDGEYSKFEYFSSLFFSSSQIGSGYRQNYLIIKYACRFLADSLKPDTDNFVNTINPKSRLVLSTYKQIYSPLRYFADRDYSNAIFDATKLLNSGSELHQVLANSILYKSYLEIDPEKAKTHKDYLDHSDFYQKFQNPSVNIAGQIYPVKIKDVVSN